MAATMYECGVPIRVGASTSACFTRSHVANQTELGAFGAESGSAGAEGRFTCDSLFEADDPEVSASASTAVAGEMSIAPTDIAKITTSPLAPSHLLISCQSMLSSSLC